MSTASTAAPITQAITMPAMAPPDRPLLDVPEAAVASAGVERPLAARTSEGSATHLQGKHRDACRSMPTKSRPVKKQLENQKTVFKQTDVQHVHVARYKLQQLMNCQPTLCPCRPIPARTARRLTPNPWQEWRSTLLRIASSCRQRMHQSTHMAHPAGPRMACTCCLAL